MPPLPAHAIQRERVVTALMEALASHCLVVLAAPPGHGKTIVAQQLLGRWKNRSLYLRMKPGWPDNTEYLWSDACAKLKEQGMPRAEELGLIGFPNDDARMYRCLAFFREYLSSAPTMLVIDDFQNANIPPLNRLLESLVSEEIPGFNLLVLGRAKPAMPLPYLQLGGYAAVPDSGLLDFTEDEARGLFKAAGVADEELADTALGFSHGWAAGLYLCLRSYLTGKVIMPVKSMDELVSGTFFAMYSPEEQCLLAQLAVMDTFSAAQAVFLTGEKTASLRLRELHEHNAFVQYSSASDSYSIHALLRSFLLQRLEENTIPACGGLDPRLLYRRAAECSLDSHNYLQAIRFLAKAGRNEDLLRILQIFENPGEGFFLLPAYEAVREIMESIPREVRLLSPVGWLGFIHRHAVRVSRAEAAVMLREAEDLFFARANLPEALQQKARGESELVRAVLSFNDIEAIFRCYESADTLLQGRSGLVNKNMFWTYNCPHSAFLYLKTPGAYERLEQLAAEKLVHFQRVSGGANAGAPELLAAERALETGRFHKAPELLEIAKYKAIETEQYTAIVAENFTRARCQLANGNADNIYTWLTTLKKPVEQREHPLLLHNLDVCLGYIASVCNDIEHIPSWLLQHEPLTVRNNQAHGFSLIVRGKALMTLGNWPRLLAFAEEAEPRFAELGNLFGRLHVLLFKAVATAGMQQRNTSPSETFLMQALDLARPDGILTSIAEYGNHLLPLLQRLGNLHPERRDLVQLGRLTKQYAKLGRKHASNLTLRETDIMELVRQGANNKDIGAKLGITQGSVANSLSRIYIKLGVGSRIEAINRWAESPPGKK